MPHHGMALEPDEVNMDRRLPIAQREYEVSYTVRRTITARSEDQAEERAGMMQDWIRLELPKGRPWAHYGETEVELDGVTEGDEV